MPWAVRPGLSAVPWAVRPELSAVPWAVRPGLSAVPWAVRPVALLGRLEASQREPPEQSGAWLAEPPVQPPARSAARQRRWVKPWQPAHRAPAARRHRPAPAPFWVISERHRPSAAHCAGPAARAYATTRPPSFVPVPHRKFTALVYLPLEKLYRRKPERIRELLVRLDPDLLRAVRTSCRQVLAAPKRFTYEHVQVCRVARAL